MKYKNAEEWYSSDEHFNTEMSWEEYKELHTPYGLTKKTKKDLVEMDFDMGVDLF